MEFKPIETQEQLDAIIGERIARAEKNADKKYADYEDLKKANADYERQITDLTSQLKAKDETITGSESTLTELQARIKQYEMASVKTRIAHEVGLPYELADKLSGDDEEAIRADAQNMVGFIKPKQVAPMGGAEPVDSGDPHKAAMQNLLKNIERR